MQLYSPSPIHLIPLSTSDSSCSHPTTWRCNCRYDEWLTASSGRLRGDPNTSVADHPVGSVDSAARAVRRAMRMETKEVEAEAEEAEAEEAEAVEVETVRLIEEAAVGHQHQWGFNTTGAAARANLRSAASAGSAGSASAAAATAAAAAVVASAAAKTAAGGALETAVLGQQSPGPWLGRGSNLDSAADTKAKADAAEERLPEEDRILTRGGTLCVRIPRPRGRAPTGKV